MVKEERENLKREPASVGITGIGIVLAMFLGASLFAAPHPAQAQISIGIGLPSISIGINLPVFPELALIPDYPVYYAPRVDANLFFYDGMYWVFRENYWYASSWYNGPWAVVAPEIVPLFVLRVPVRFYRQPPVFFAGWDPREPPRWGQHWGGEWERNHGGWDRWDRSQRFAPAPLPTYQRQYSGDRYPRAVEQQQRILVQNNYSYQPREPVVRQHFEQHAAPQRVRQEVTGQTGGQTGGQRGQAVEPRGQRGQGQQPGQQPERQVTPQQQRVSPGVAPGVATGVTPPPQQEMSRGQRGQGQPGERGQKGREQQVAPQPQQQPQRVEPSTQVVPPRARPVGAPAQKPQRPSVQRAAPAQPAQPKQPPVVERKQVQQSERQATPQPQRSAPAPQAPQRAESQQAPRPQSQERIRQRQEPQPQQPEPGQSGGQQGGQSGGQPGQEGHRGR